MYGSKIMRVSTPPAYISRGGVGFGGRVLNSRNSWGSKSYVLGNDNNDGNNNVRNNNRMYSSVCSPRNNKLLFDGGDDSSEKSIDLIVDNNVLVMKNSTLHPHRDRLTQSCATTGTPSYLTIEKQILLSPTGRRRSSSFSNCPSHAVSRRPKTHSGILKLKGNDEDNNDGSGGCNNTMGSSVCNSNASKFKPVINNLDSSSPFSSPSSSPPSHHTYPLRIVELQEMPASLQQKLIEKKMNEEKNKRINSKPRSLSSWGVNINKNRNRNMGVGMGVGGGGEVNSIAYEERYDNGFLFVLILNVFFNTNV
jgi:hypothetical protein